MFDIDLVEVGGRGIVLNNEFVFEYVLCLDNFVGWSLLF